MLENIKLPWRNIWRNKRRTLITISSVFFTMFFALLMRSMQVGSYSGMTNNIVEVFSGHIQVHSNGFWESQSINDVMFQTPELYQKIGVVENVRVMVPRIESFGLASFGVQTKDAMIVGIDPEKEKELTNPEKNLLQGSYLDDNGGVLIGKRLSDFLKIQVGDSLVLLSQGYHGVSAAGIYCVRGIVKLSNPEMDRRMVFINLTDAQEMFGAYNMVSSIAINLKNPDKLDATNKAIYESLSDEEYEIMSWTQMYPELVQQIESDQYSGYIMLGLLYLIVGFGVFGTVLMMTSERKREFAVMVAIGMQKTKLAVMVTVEMFLIGLIGILAGVLCSLPLIGYLYAHPLPLTDQQMVDMMEEYGMEPVVYFGLNSDFYFGQIEAVVVIFLLAILYPIYKVSRINESQALRA